MTRADEIRKLRVRHLIAVSQRKHKTAALIYARLLSLVARQLRAEAREERRAS